MEQAMAHLLRCRPHPLFRLYRPPRLTIASPRHGITLHASQVPVGVIAPVLVGLCRITFPRDLVETAWLRSGWEHLGRLVPDSSASSLVQRPTAHVRRYVRLTCRISGRPIEEVFLGLVEYICPEGGTVDEGIAREAFIETIADLAANEIVDIDSLTAEQLQMIFELYATHAIEARLCNDIGTKSITMPADASDAARVQTQLLEFVRRSVADALTSARVAIQALTPDRVLGFVTHVYEQAFSILQSLGDAEADTT